MVALGSKAQKKRNQETWQSELLVLPTGFSLHWGGVRSGLFPCVTPNQRYVVLQNGKAHLASGLDVMALQGIQSKEIAYFKMGLADDGLLRDLAGNAFTANIIAVFLIAALLSM